MNKDRSAVFDETYNKYLTEISQIDFLKKADALGVERDGECLLIPLYGQQYRLSLSGLEKDGESVTSPGVRVIICKYILTCSESVDESLGELKAYREFKDAGPLVINFHNNTSKSLESFYTGKLDELQKRCLELGGEPMESPTYDLSFLFYALPRIPVLLNFNDEDDMFPASCSVLYRSSASRFLDMECLSMTGSMLSGMLRHL